MKKTSFWGRTVFLKIFLFTSKNVCIFLPLLINFLKISYIKPTTHSIQIWNTINWNVVFLLTSFELFKKYGKYRIETL